MAHPRTEIREEPPRGVSTFQAYTSGTPTPAGIATQLYNDPMAHNNEYNNYEIISQFQVAPIGASHLTIIKGQK